MSSAYALPLDRQIKARDSSRNSNSSKSLVLSILMISMSLSTGIIEVNQPTSDLEKSPAEFDIPGISEKLSELIMPIAKVLWPADDTGELNPDESQSSMTGARSSPPILSLSTSSVALIYGENVNPTITPSNSGGAVTSWSISPTLPSGLSFGTGNGTIWGNPTALSGATDYTITGTNSFGSDFVVIEIEVVQESPIIQYSVTSYTFNKNTPISPISPTVYRGTGITWSVSPSLPTGITIDSATGVISGTPASASASTTYTVTATNAGGAASVPLTIQVNDIPPSNIQYSPDSFVLTKGVAMTTVTPTTAGGTVVSWSITPSLPSGLLFDTLTGVISGTPTVISPSATYTVTATNSGGSSSATLTFVVNDAPPSNIVYNPNSFVLTKGVAMTSPNTNAPSHGGGTVVSWTVSPSLPVGLSLNSNGAITGTPTVVSTSTIYTVTATNTGGNSTATVTIQVNDVPPAFSYSYASLTLETGSAMTPISPTLYGSGAVDSWSVSPTLPNGLSLDTSTGVISGTPTTITPSQTYTITATNTGGSSSVPLDIEVNDQLPIISYTTTSFTYTKGTTISPVTPTNGGGAVITWEVHPSLPNGLVLDSSTGEITGTPTTVSASAVYTVYANNSGGSDTAVLTIEVIDVPPTSITYNPNSFIETKGVAMTPVIPTSTGGDVVSWEIYPSLPSGLSIDSSTGEISGTPSVLSTLTTYTIYANNTGGGITTTIDITVIDAAPSSISYNPNSFTETKGIAMSPASPTSSGGAVVTWSISPSLPSGLSIDSSTGEISGTPTVLSTTPVTYTITATNTGGFDTTTVEITINDVAPSSITYSGSPYTYTKGQFSMDVHTPTSSGGAVVSWSISPAVPSGMSFDTSTGAISGTPNIISPTTTYTVTATNSGGSDTVTIQITVNDEAPNISYNTGPHVLTKDTTMSSLAPVSTGGTVVSWSVSPTLPAGLSIDASGIIAGTPTAITPATNYIVTATNTGGTDTATITIQVNDVMPSSISYNPNTFTETRGTAMTPVSPTVGGGGAVTSWEIHPSLPTGLNIDSSTGEISGTPSIISTLTTYTVYANNTGGSANTNIDITVNDIIPSSVAYSPSSHVLTKGTAMTPVTPTSNGGPVVSWSILPTLPAGLSIDSSTGEISGTPTALATLTTYTITATNTGGSATATVDITVNDVAPSLIEYSGSPFSLTKDSAFSSGTPTYSGGAVVSWSVSPSLPDGLSLNPSTGVISGVPTTITSNGTYTITATNTGGSDSVNIAVEVNDIIPSSIAYSPNAFVLTKGTPMNSVSPTSSGGAVISWSISPGLPSGLSIDATTGEISGTPTVLSTITTYTITGTNSGGSATTTVDITVNDIVPSSITYTATSFVETKDSSMTTGVPGVSGGPVVSWSISPSLPTGLSIDSNTGEVSGTPTVLSSFTIYTITATNTGGSTTTTIDITVNDIVPSGITYSSNSYVETKGSSMTTGVPAVSGGPVVTWSVSPSLPSGLSIDSSTGEISGTPNALSTITTYTITATNTGGSATTTIDITVNDVIPSAITYSSNSYVETKDSPMTTGTPTASGGPVVTWSISPTLPTGITIDSSTGEISGTPTVLSTITTYTVTGTNSGGSATTTIDLTINDIIPSGITYSSTSYVETKGELMTTGTPTVSGGTVVTWTVSPSLPTGLNIDSTTGEISGTPTILSTLTTYTITATNTGGSATTTIDITVNDVAPSSLSYTPSSLVETRDSPMSAASPTISGGPVVSWSISPALPNGISIDSSGVISGTPTVISSLTTYTITATNTGGSATTTLDLVVRDIVPSNLDYTPSSFILSLNTPMNPVTPTSSGGPVVSWSVNPALPTGLSIDSATGTISGTPTQITPSGTYTITATNSGGSDSITVTIEVNDIIPSEVEYNPSSFTLTKGTSMNAATPTSSGGTVVSWTISPSLPAGLTIDSATGEISGTPTILSAITTYTVTATNTGGSATTTIDITVNDVIPSAITYSSTSYVETKDAAMTTGTPSVSGGPVVSWAISPGLPTGLSIDSSTGEISGTPTILSTVTTYTITATNTGGSATTTIDITVNDVIPSGITYSSTSYVETKDAAMTTGTPTVSGGPVVTWSISPSLPTGITIDSSTGEISGTPTVLSTVTTYTITATNSGGSATTTIDITVNDVAPSGITYSGDPFSLTKDSTVSATPPTYSGGTVTSWSVSPSLPTGLTLDPSTGAITGTPTDITPSATYTITAANSGGSTTVDITIEVNDVIPSGITYNPSSFVETVGTAMSSVSPTASGGIITSWTISPSLPSGLNFDGTTGEISGTPTVVSSLTTYTITASNTGGSATATVDITVNDVIPSAITYNPSTFVETKGVAMSSVSPTSTGGVVTSWEISPDLPIGITLDGTTGEISGTPTVLSSLTTYTVYANNTGGSASTTIDFTVNDVIPSAITYSSTSYVETKDAVMTTGTPTVSGGPVVTWSISPALPTGISIDSSTGEISGTPTVLSTITTYTITATNTGGSATTTIDITVNDVIPSALSYSGSPFTLTKDVAMTSNLPSYSGGTVTSWTVSPALPNGLSIDSATGEISGTPTDITASATYTVTASNSGGSDTVDITIVVNDEIPSAVSYNPSTFVVEKGSQLSSGLPSSSGGAVTSWTISPTLPTGLTIDATTGEISGTPTVISATTTYTVTATNTGGSATTTVDITVNDVAPYALFYAGSPYTFTKDSAISPITPSSLGGAVVTWSVAPTLPSGLTIDSSTGTISGTPTTITLSSTYVITAANSGGSDNVSIVIQVNDIVPSISYSGAPFTLTKDATMSPAAPTNSGGAVVSWSVTPGLPAGLTLSTTTGVITGTPTAVTSSATYTISATNTGGTASTIVEITVNDIAPNTIAYSPNTLTLTKDASMTPAMPTSSGGAVVSWSVSPALPTGLSINSATGEISGTPTVLSSATSYTVTATNTGGSATTLITISVIEAPPSSITYNPNSFTLTKGTAMTAPVVPTASGDPAVSWSITPSLPTGIVFDTATGAISGTPSIVSPSTTYTVTATNNGGSGTTTITMQVNDIAPSAITYNPSSLSLAEGVTMSSVTPTSSGGDVVSWTISPTLPAGLLIDSATGTISGTPTSTSPSTIYTVTATNTGGSASATVTIIVNDAPPSSITYNPSSFTLTKDSAMTNTTPTTSGGAVVSWSIAPSLPTGLAFNATTGELSGTPTVISPSTVYTVTATNAGGSGTTTVVIQVNDIAPNTIIYNPSSLSLTKGATMTPATPSVSGGDVVSWTVSPTLPSGLSIDATTGTISGSPVSLSSSASYTVTATNTGGSATAVLTIEVLEAPPSSITYVPGSFTLTIGTPMNSVTPTANGDPAVSWSISPNLPSGLTFDSNTGELGGTPNAVSPLTTYTVTATNNGGSGTATITIKVNDVAPSSINYSPNFLELNKDAAMSQVTPTYTGGTVDTWSVSPALPNGLIFNTATGSISGTPTSITAENTYTVTATNTGGSATATVTIIVNDAPPSSIVYNPSSFTLTKGTAMNDVTPTFGGGAVETWSISPSLPSGLVFESSNGTISGTPTAISSSTVYTITATNPGGSANATITIEVNDVQPYAIAYSGNPFTLTKGTVMSANTPTASGGAVDSWSISPQLPTGLTFSTSNGEISGTPSVISSLTNYVVTATNTGGSATTTITIVVNDVIPSAITYGGTPYTLTKGTTMTPDTPSVSGGTVVSWSITPSLPTGLNFDTTSGEISGTPSTVSSSTTYTVSATNTGGTATTTIDIVIYDAVPVIDYTPSSYSLTKGTAMNAATPTSGGGAVVTWSISPSLPSGLTFSITNGVISGTPSAIISSTVFTITASNAGGTDTATVTIEVNDVAPSAVSYTPNSFSLSKGSLMQTVTPTYVGGTVTSWTISPQLPTGLAFSASTGAISGTPTAITSSSAYTVTATNTGGSATTIVTIEVNEAVPVITYSTSSLTLQVGLQMSAISPTSSGGPVATWTISPNLPSGLSFDTTNGGISGTPSVVSPSTVYTVTASNNGGSDTASVTIQVNDVAPSSITYNPTFFSLTKGTAMADATPTNLGGTITSWSVNPGLPTGLSINSVNGTISGTPSTVSPATTYTITGSNSGGSASTTITIIVYDAAPSSIIYNPSSSVLTVGVSMGNVTPTYSGGIATSWTISPSLPAGLSFNTTNGTIGGTPTAISPFTSYTVTATNAGGSGTTTITIQVNDVPPYGVSYGGSPFTFTVGTLITPVVPASNGGQVDTWSISPALPTGLTINPSTGELSGNPSVISSTTAYTITATNTGGTTTATVSITVNDVIPSGITYNANPYTLTKDSAMTPDTPSVSGGAVESWSITPSLPTGLTFNTSTGEISGTPTVVLPTTSYTVTATNTGGSATATIEILVNDAPPSSVAYSGGPFTFEKGTTISPLMPTASGGAVESWSVSPTLPTGLVLDSATGEISGTPTVISPSATYTITATNAGGSDSTTITIEVNDVPPSSVAYNPNAFSLSKDSQMNSVIPNYSGGVVETWTVSPALPAGLTLDSSTGEISGTPTAITAYGSYTITATNTGGSATTTITIIVNDAAPNNIAYSGSPFILTKGTAITPTTPTASGGAATFWSIAPQLPAGLTFNTSTGEISGTPTAISSSATYTVTATNAGGSGTGTLVIQVNDVAPSAITYTPSLLSLAKNSTMTAITPTNTGGVITSWTVNPSLPVGLVLDSSTGEISGTPTAITALAVYTITGTNTGGGATTTVTIIVNDEIPYAINYNPSSQTLTKGSAMAAVIPTASGGAVNSWSISPALPAGLSIDTTSGEISGTPTAVSPSTVYTITATNLGGSGTGTITIQVNDIPPFSVVYSGSPYTLTNGTAMAADTPTSSGGTVENWSITPNLPLGLVFDNITGTISGTPTENSPTATYTIVATNTGGNATVTVSITVNDVVPSAITYSGSPFTLTNGVAMSANTPSAAGGAVDSWSISPALPTGLTFDTATGEISGTPTVISPLTTYTITATNTGGSDTATITLQVNDVAPSSIVYSGTPYTLTNNTAMQPDIPTSTGGPVVSWSISPALPSGLVFDTATGEISGTPTSVTSLTNYTVTATNTGGNTTTIVSITVIDVVPTIDYPINDLSLINNTASTDLPLIPTITGPGDIVSWAINPTLPTGLTFDSATGEISGTPSTLLARSMFTITGTNSGGTTSIDINITIVDEVPVITYQPDDLTLSNNTVSSDLPLDATLTGPGEIVSWTVSPNMPSGLTFDTATGTISGTPTELLDRTMFTITGTNSGGSATTYINLTINDEIPTIVYTPDDLTMVNNTASVDLPLTPTVSGAGEITSWTIEPTLPEGLAFDTSTGIISGTATEIVGRTMFTINGTNTGGTVTSFINITVVTNDPVVAYVPDDISLLSNSSVLDLSPISTGGLVTQWSITPELSAGLYFNNTTGQLSGTPTEMVSRTQYTITASNDDGTMFVNLNITVEDTVYELPSGPIYLLNGSGIIPLIPISTITDSTFEIHPELPEGMIFNETNGEISGTPTEVIGLTNFTIYSNSSQLSDSVVIELEVLEDTDGDGEPNTLPEDYSGDLIEDLDDDGDGFSDILENDCSTDSTDSQSMPSDLDGDTVCDTLDDDIDGDGIPNDEEANSGDHIGDGDEQTDTINPDSDGDGICDGPSSPNETICVAGPDAFPNDSAASVDTDGDGMPDELNGESTTGLIEDDDDDNDGWTDSQESQCGTTSADNNSTPIDSDGDLICNSVDDDDDGDGWSDDEEQLCGTTNSDNNSIPLDKDGDGQCDTLDTVVDLPFNLTYPTNNLELTLGEEMTPLLPNITGEGDVDTWELEGELPEGLIFGWSPARDAQLDGSIRGTPTSEMNTTTYTIWGNNSQVSRSYELTISVAENTNDTEIEDSDDGKDSESKLIYALCCLPLILLLLLLPFLLKRKEDYDDAEPEHTTAKPKFAEGDGSEEDPFVLKPAKTVKPGETILSKELITITNITPGLQIKSVDFQDNVNDGKFTMQDQAGSDEGVRIIEADEDGTMKFRIIFDDSHEPTLGGGEFRGAIKIGHKSVYLLWDVNVKPDPEYVKEQKKLEAERKKAEREAEQAEAKAEKEAKAAEEKAAKEAKAAEEKAAKEAKAAEEKAAKEAKAAEEKAAKEAKAAEEKAAKEAKAAEEKAAKEAKAAEEKLLPLLVPLLLRKPKMKQMPKRRQMKKPRPRRKPKRKPKRLLRSQRKRKKSRNKKNSSESNHVLRILISRL